MTIYNGFNAAKRYKRVLVHSDRVAQSSEQNETQSIIDHRITRIADVLYADGGITEGARCTVNAETGACTLEAGRIYIAGDVHDLDAAALQVPVVGTVYVGVFYVEKIITAIDDPDLYNKAVDAAGYGEPGADRLQVLTQWGVQGDAQAGDFYPVWTIEDGYVRPREPAPNLSAVTKALERYDVESAGGLYASRGLVTVQQPDDEQGRQVFTITEGAARIGGVSVVMPAARRVVFDPKPDFELVESEPHNIDTNGLQHVKFDRYPVLQTARVSIQRPRTDNIVHGAYAGVADPFPVNAVVKINQIKQGATIYAKDVDYKLTAGQIDWSPNGAEPIPGSQYEVQYEYISTEDALNQTPTGFDVLGAVAQTVIRVDYTYALRRVDRVVLQGDGALTVIRGVPATWQPVAPSVPSNALALATVYQTWDAATRRTEADAVMTVPMDELKDYKRQLNDLKLDQAELRLATDLSARYGGLRKGYFADPMLDNSMRDQGFEQTAMISGGALQLYENEQAHMLGDGVASHGLAYVLVSALAQKSASRSMPINGDGVAGALPATVTLSPSVDRWESPTLLKYPRNVNVGGIKPGDSATALQQKNFDASVKAELLNIGDVYMREIEVTFDIQGFRPLEALESVQFDGVAVAAQVLVGGSLIADARGVLKAKFTVPAGVLVGTKSVEFKGANGTVGTAQYTGGAIFRVRVTGRFATIFGGYGAMTNTLTYVV